MVICETQAAQDRTINLPIHHPTGEAGPAQRLGLGQSLAPNPWFALLVGGSPESSHRARATALKRQQVEQAGSEPCEDVCPWVPWDSCSCRSDLVPVPSVWDNVLCYGMRWLIKIFAMSPWLLLPLKERAASHQEGPHSRRFAGRGGIWP